MSGTAAHEVARLLAAAGLDAGPVQGVALDHGMSGDLVFRLDAPMRAFAKIAAPGRRISRVEMQREIDVLRWLDGRIGAPRLIWGGMLDEDRPALLMQALDGVALHAAPAGDAEAGAIVAIRALAALHALPTADCPFDERLARRMREVRLRVQLGEVDAAGFDPGHTGRTAAEVLEQLEATRPESEDLVVTHGDASWPNFLIHQGRVGLIDLGRAGLADRHHDLALFVRSGRRNAPDLDTPALIREHYPLETLDEDRLEFYRLLDELY
ncbi:APH(3') family aminoglycoside O-phosphotransferase [Caulobacter sp. KR2-114]|uniref:APH(3') family aminoglycoside O-phosphotransferase n=1 Tax=Caulobacter sp. KR2-114 TaxID=3400912 RepID=UPI003C0D66B0